ncbi:N-acetylmuramoyl-L-alanine amidase-like domain-containing protein [Prevotella sp. S7 MS 2]|uniref:N-acetylmuramoyl-L-alanine amidase-like domain-containing protein n=1 Tax=Prevotella sp. S7 MS 2 TaxID=1287488 RepID=UPI000512A3AF|nr:N-acetylmuramoyl-L-alanine amidase-like domain-containing protein [Prevotella sp. S7 MS 2]KGI61074.1 xylanase [Prevotella sp. S7 MS 2]
MYRKLLFIIISLNTIVAKAAAQQIQYTKYDSTKVVSLLKQAKTRKANTNYVLFFARQLVNIPYVAKTLENNQSEKLVINLRELDCTTYVENVLALTLCAKKKQITFKDFCHYLQTIRYEQGSIHYTNRHHYFTEWIISNTKLGLVKDRQTTKAPFTGIQKINVSYMSEHPQYYPMLVKNSTWKTAIARMEKDLNGLTYRYIPKKTIANTSLFKNSIKDGDIIAIITNKRGLDTSHIGIAVWHRDGLHMLNASQIRKKVVEEPMLLRTYMSKHPIQIGIRVIEIK